MSPSYLPELRKRLKNVTTSLSDLPAMTDIVVDFMAALNDPNAAAKEFAAIIAKDPTVAARVMRITNSAYYGFERKISSLEHAVAILGLRTLRGLVVAASLTALSRRFGLMEKMLLDDSLGCAIASRILAERCGQALMADDAFLAGLMRHIGKVVMCANEPERFAQVIEAVYNGEGNTRDMEGRHFPYTHAELGAAVLDHWKFAPSIVACAYFHDGCTLEEADDPITFNLVTLVSLAGALCRKQGIGCRVPETELDLMELAATKRLGFSAEALESARTEFVAVYEELHHAFGH